MKPEDVMEALELCNTPRSGVCKICPYHEFGASCHTKRNADALALLREKDAEIERLTGICDSYALQYGTAVDKEVFLKKEREDTMRKMIDAARKQAFMAGDNQYISIAELEEIVKEIQED